VGSLQSAPESVAHTSTLSVDAHPAIVTGKMMLWSAMQSLRLTPSPFTELLRFVTAEPLPAIR
jgi:hypothetical protein